MGVNPLSELVRALARHAASIDHTTSISRGPKYGAYEETKSGL